MNLSSGQAFRGLLLLSLATSLAGCKGNALDGFVDDGGETGNSAITFDPTLLNFGNTGRAPAYVEKTVTVTNTTAAPIFITSFTPDNTEFTVVANTCAMSPLQLDSRSTCALTLRFSPASEGDHSGVLRTVFGTAAGDTSFAVNLGLAGRSTSDGVGNAGLSFTPSPYDYGEVAVSSSADRSFTVRNLTAGNLYMSGFASNSAIFTVVSTTCPVSPAPIAANATCNVVLRFAPSASGRFLATLSALYGSSELQPGLYEAYVNVSGSTPASSVGAPALGFSPEFWDFGDRSLGTNITKTFTITNNAGSTLYIGSIQPATGATDYAVQSVTCPLGLNPFANGATCTITVAFSPTVEGTNSIAIEFKYGTLSGANTALLQKILVTGRSSPAPISSGSISFTPSFWDYGDVAAFQSVSKQVTIRNTAPTPIYIGSVERTDASHFALSHDCPASPATLAPNATCLATVIFTPNADGSYSTDLTVNYGPNAGQSTSVQSKMILIGRSISTPVGNASVSFSPTYWDFGDIAISSFGNKTVTVTNTGTLPIYIGGLASSDSDFSVVSPTCPTGATALAAAATCTFTLRYLPSAAGIDTTDVVLSYGLDQARNTNLTKTMTASGRSTPGGSGSSPFTYDPTFWDFGDVAATVTVRKTFTVTNTSPDPQFISNITRSNGVIFGVSHDCPISPSSLAVGAVCNVEVSFTPAADGVQSSLISVIYGPDAPRSGNSTSKFAVAGRSTAATRGNASISYTPGYWDYGDVPRNVPQDKAIVLTNSSTSPVYISTVNLSAAGSFLITSNDCPTGATSLASGATCTVNVRFTPTADVLENVTVRAYYGPDQQRSSNLMSTMILAGRSIAVPPGQSILSASPGFVDFGDVAQTNSTSQTITITNVSGANAYISSVTRSNTGAFGVSHTCPVSPSALANAATCTVTLSFAPNAEGAHSTRVDIAHGNSAFASTNLVYSFFAQGRSTAAATGNVALTYNPAAWDFGDVAAGANSTKVVTITNSDASAIYLGTASSDNARFTITANTCPTGATSLAAAATCTVTLRFAPLADGGQSGFLSYTYGPDQARSGNLVSRMAISGRSTAAPLGNQSLTFTPTSWDYGDVASGQTAARTFTITNAYASPLFISGFTSTGARYTVASDTCPRSPTSLAAAATCTVTVNFAPVADGAFSSDVSVQYGPDHPRSMNLSAFLSVTGRSTTATIGNPALGYNPTYRDFGNILVGQNASLSFTLQNTSASPIYLGGASVSLADFAITANNCPSGATALAAAATCSITVKYTPTDEGSDIGELRMNYGPDQARASNLVARASIIAKSDPPPVGNAALVLTPNTWDFGSVGLSPAFADKVITVQNSSARNLYFGGFSGLSASFSVNSTTCPSGATALAAGATCTVTVRFSPLSGPQVSQTMTMAYGVSAGAPSDYNSQAQFTGRSTPNPPTNFRFTGGDASTIDFAWDGNDSDQTSFEIERCNGAACETTFTTAATVTGVLNTARSYHATGLAEGQIYRFRIRGIAGSTQSPWLTGPATLVFGGITSVDNATGLSTSLSQINCTTAAVGSYVGLYWNPVANAAYFQVFDVESGSPQFVRNVDNNQAGTISSTVITGLPAATDKSYIVKAFTVSGVSSVNQTASPRTTVAYTPCMAVGQSSMSAWNTAPAFQNPRSISIGGGKMAVADQTNNRVLIWNTVPTSQFQPADVVVGQPDFDSILANNSGVRTDPAAVSAKSLNSPRSVMLKGGKLYVADTSNHRVLIWNTVPTSNFAPADIVLGQSNFTNRTAIGTSNCAVAQYQGKAFNTPGGVFVDSGGYVYVLDTSNHRILVYTSAITGNYQAANVALGVASVASACPGASVTQSTFNAPENLYVSGNNIFVADRGNKRVLKFDRSSLASGMNASAVWGQATYTTNAAANTQNGFNDPIGIWGDDLTSSANIYVADYGANRVLRFASTNWGMTPNADSVIGQTTFTATGANETTTTLRGPIAGYAANSAGADSGVWVVGYGNFRITHYGYTAANTNTPASNLLLGAARYATNIYPTNTSGLSLSRHLRPVGVSVGGGKMAMADYMANRVVLYDTVPTSHLAAASRVIGQTTPTAADPNQGGTVTLSTMNQPMGVWTNGQHLLVVDNGSSRVLGWRNWPTSDGQAADFVLGQSTSTTSAAGNGSNQLNSPASVFASPYPGAASTFNYIWVADRGASRVVAYQTGWTTVPLDPPAAGLAHVLVLGQTSITGTAGARVTQDGLNVPRGVWSDGTRVVVADTGNNRVMIWDGAATPITGQNADFVLGQPDFTSNTANNGGLSESSMNQPTSVFVDNGRLFVVDQGNHRILVWNTFPTASQQPADRVYGQSSFVAGSLNGGGTYPNAYLFQYPTNIWIDVGRLFLTDGFNIGNVNSVTNNRMIAFPSY